MKRSIWLTKANYLVIVRKADVGVYFYEYARDEFVMLEKSPSEFGLEYVGDL